MRGMNGDSLLQMCYALYVYYKVDLEHIAKIANIQIINYHPLELRYSVSYPEMDTLLSFHITLFY